MFYAPLLLRWFLFFFFTINGCNRRLGYLQPQIVRRYAQMDRIILERDDQSPYSAAGRYPVTILQVVQYSLPALGLALLKIKRSKDKKQGQKQEDTQAAASRSCLQQKHIYRVIHHAKIA